MNLDAFQSYFSDILLSDSVKERIGTILANISELYEKISFNDIFLCEINNGGIREYTSLWLFSDNHIIECKNFLNQDDFDLAGVNKNVMYFNVKKKEYYDWSNPTQNSNVSIVVLLNNAKISCSFMASGVNCKYAVAIAKKYFLANMITVR